MPGTLLESYGGLPFVSRLVMDFYDRVQETDRLNGYFTGIDMRRLVDHQAKFISTLLGGPISYSDEMLAEIHAGLDISDADFDVMIGLLEETLAKFDLNNADKAYVVEEFRKRRSVLVKRG